MESYKLENKMSVSQAKYIITLIEEKNFSTCTVGTSVT